MLLKNLVVSVFLLSACGASHNPVVVDGILFYVEGDRDDFDTYKVGMVLYEVQTAFAYYYGGFVLSDLTSVVQLTVVWPGYGGYDKQRDAIGLDEPIEGTKVIPVQSTPGIVVQMNLYQVLAQAMVDFIAVHYLGDSGAHIETGILDLMRERLYIRVDVVVR